ncbi:MAG: NfeD family protein [Bacillota bacterium]
MSSSESKVFNNFFILGLVVFVLLLMSINISAVNGELTYLIKIEGEIDNGIFELVERGLEEAENVNADYLIFELDTPGGYLDPALKIRDQILQSEITTIAYVRGRAWSAAALISLATEELIMLSGSSIGAAEPRPYDEKTVSALTREFKATAETRNRNPELAAAMVDSDIAIDGIIEKDKILTLTAEEAVENNIAERRIENIDELYDLYNINSDNIVEIEMTLAEKAARLITKPTFTTLLISIALIALIAEALMPGFGLAGSIGIVSLGLVFSSYAYYGVAGWGLVLLFGIGLLLIVIEILVIPDFGFTGLAGILFISSSIYFLFPDPKTAFRAIGIIIISVFFTTIILLKIFGTSNIWKRISLEKRETLESGYVGVKDNSFLENKQGITITPLRPAGIADIEGERIDVVSDGRFIDRGEEIMVSKILGNRIVVKKI